MSKRTSIGLTAMALAMSLAGSGAALTPPTSGTVNPCTGWTLRTVVSGLGSLENVEPDGKGGVFISRSTASAVDRIGPNLRESTVLANVPSPGGLRLRGTTLYVVTGDAAQSGVLGKADGTLLALDLRTGKSRVVAGGLVMPNGLALDRAGHAYVSRDIGPGLGVGNGSGRATGLGLGTGITRITLPGRAGTGTVQKGWAVTDDSNGLAVDAAGKWIYADQTFTLDSAIYRYRLDNPAVVEQVASLAGVGDVAGLVGAPKGLDDLAMDARGALYIAANSAGQVIRLDPVSHLACVVVSGMQTTSAVKIGRAFGAKSDRLYIVGFDGLLREATPPAGVRLGAATR